MNILIIGGTRFIGRQVIETLLEKGHDITLYNRGRTANPYLSRVKQIVGDRKIEGDLLAKTKDYQFDVVIDMIAYNEFDANEAIKAFDNKVEHYIMVSTRSVYKQPINIPIREIDVLEDNAEVSYGYNKVMAEKALFSSFKNNNFPVTILRLPAVYGEHDYQAREWYFIKRILDKRNSILLPDFGFGINQREYTGNIADQISFIIDNRSKTIGEAFNSGHKNYSTYKDLVEKACEIMGHKFEYFGVNNSEMPWQVPLANDGVRICSTGKLESIGYQERYTVEDGLARIIKFFTDNPVSEFLFAKRQDIDMFDYSKEDSLINSVSKKL